MRREWWNLSRIYLRWCCCENKPIIELNIPLIDPESSSSPTLILVIGMLRILADKFLRVKLTFISSHSFSNQCRLISYQWLILFHNLAKTIQQ